MAVEEERAPDIRASMRGNPRTAWWVLGGALLAHVLVMPASGWERDVYWFGTWMRVAMENGAAHVSEKVWCDYPPGYLYLLEGIGYLWRLMTGMPVPAEDTEAMRFLVKIPPTMADLAAAWVLYRLALSRLGQTAALLVLVAYAYNPAMLFNGPFWGQADSLISLFILLSVWAVSRRRYALGFGLAAAAILVKFQAVVLLPALCIAAARADGSKGLRDACRGAALTAFVLLLPFFWARDVDSVISTALGAVGRYPYISNNAHNVWWLLGGPSSPSISDIIRVGNGLLTYRTLGTAMFAVATVVIMFRLWRNLGAGEGTMPALLDACALEMMALYLFATQMHERYLVPVLVLLAASCIWRPRRWPLYLALSLGVLLSLASTLHAYWPANLGALGAWFPAGQQETTILSGLFLALFLTLLLWTSDVCFVLLVPVSLVVLGSSIAAVAYAPIKSPQRLCDMVPVTYAQQWGELRHDRSVDDHRLAVLAFIFRHGIGTHANSQLTYHLNGAFRMLDTMYGVDDEANRGQNIRFRISVDGHVRFDTGVISGYRLPGHARVRVKGAQYLTLEVLDGGDGIDSDHADWLEPMLLR